MRWFSDHYVTSFKDPKGVQSTEGNGTHQPGIGPPGNVPSRGYGETHFVAGASAMSTQEGFFRLAEID